MGHDKPLQQRIERIGELVAQIEATADPNVRALARDLVESLMAFHGAGLERILELASEAGPAGDKLIQQCGRDELAGSLLLLYGLHPEDLHARVTHALEESRAFLNSHAAKAEVISIGESGVTVRLHQKPNGCGSTAATVKATLEAALLNAAPDAAAIVVEEVGREAPASGFVALTQLTGGKTTAAALGARVQSGGE